MSSERWRDLTGSVRVRATIAALAVLGIALLIASAAMVVLLRRTLTADVRASAKLRSVTVARALAAGEHDRPIIEVGNLEEEFVQVVDERGQVVASSRNLAGRPAISLAVGASRRIEGLSFEDDPFLAVAMRAVTPDGPMKVIAGRTMEAVTESSTAVIGLLGAGVPLLLLLCGGVTWWLVGRALAPVEAIRSEAEAISTKELHRRLPHPPGRDEIARLAQTMNGMLARLERGHLRQRRLVADASHELRSPVASIRQHAEVARSHPGSTQIPELAEVILDEGKRLEGLVDDLLLLSRLDEATALSDKRPVDLDDLLFGEAKRLRAAGGVDVDATAVSAGRVLGDRAQLLRAIRNLTENAARHARRSVALSLGNEGGEVVLRVDDDGEGIPPSERKRVFERFVRLDDARARDSGGSGLGLAIVAEVVGAHGGTVAIRDAPGGGTRVEVRLPSSE